MPYLLDTNICIYIIKKQPAIVLEKFSSVQPGELALSTITVAELEFGVRKSSNAAKNLAALNKFLIPFNLLDFDHAAAKEYGLIRNSLEAKGTPIGPLDTLIAAHAISLQYTLVTNNEREFSRIAQLRIENWAQ
jgi:tRNA(fMet)-specific endonuclease VapC